MPVGVTDNHFGHKFRSLSMSTASLPATLQSQVSALYLLMCSFAQLLLMLYTHMQINVMYYNNTLAVFEIMRSILTSKIIVIIAIYSCLLSLRLH